jgi:hypothetical protein
MEDYVEKHNMRALLEKVLDKYPYHVNIDGTPDLPFRYTKSNVLDAMQEALDTCNKAWKSKDEDLTYAVQQIKKLEVDVRDAYQQCDEEREEKESLQCYRNELVEDNENWKLQFEKIEAHNLRLTKICAAMEYYVNTNLHWEAGHFAEQIKKEINSILKQ